MKAALSFKSHIFVLLSLQNKALLTYIYIYIYRPCVDENERCCPLSRGRVGEMGQKKQLRSW